MAGELYRTYEVLIEESIHPEHPKRAKSGKDDHYGDGKVHEALLTTNAMFQDAVCYYTIMLAGLAGETLDGQNNLLNPLWHEIATPQGKYKTQADRVVQRLAGRYAAIKGSNDASSLVRKVMFPASDGSERSKEQQEKVSQYGATTYRILQQKANTEDEEGEIESGEKLNTFASSWASIICDPEGETIIPGAGVFDLIHQKLKGRSDEYQMTEVDAEIRTALSEAQNQLKKHFEETFAKELTEMAARKTKAIASAKSERAKAKKDVEWSEKIEAKKNAKDEELAEFLKTNRENARTTIKKSLEAGLRQEPSDLNLNEAEVEAVDAQLKVLAAAAVPDDRAVRLRYGKNANSFEPVLLRYWFARALPESNPRKAELLGATWKDLQVYVQKEKPEEPPKIDGQTVERMPYAGDFRIAFPLFAKLCSGISTRDRSPWWEFDKAAFVFAADDVFKYKRRTRERADKVTMLHCLVDCALNKDGRTVLNEDDSPTGKELEIKGMKSDPRRVAMEKLLDTLAGQKGLERGYGLRAGTIGGWGEVRDALQKTEREAAKAKRELSEADLVNAVDQCQAENSQGFGSAEFFHALCAPAFRSVWAIEGAAKEGANPAIADFVREYVRFLEHKEELVFLLVEGAAWENLPTADMIQPISYTFPGEINRQGKISQRHFSFQSELRESFVFAKLFWKSSAGSCQVLKNTAVKLSARRLKRDRVMSAGGDTIKALWCPPLVAEPAEAPEAGKRKQSAGANKEISFSLSVDVEQDCTKLQAVHLKVQLPVTLTRLNDTIRSDRRDWKDSWEWQKDGQVYFGKFFRWPSDRLSKALWAIGRLKNHSAWKNGSSQLAVWRKEIMAEPKKTTGERIAGLVEAATQNHAGDKDKLRVKSAVAELKKLGGKVWCQGTDKWEDFHLLSVDLGNRFAAAFARLRVHRDGGAPNPGRVISPDHGWANPIFAQLVENRILRLQGENAMVWDHKRAADGTCLKDGAGNYIYELQPEGYGNDGRGRFPTKGEKSETEAFEKLANDILPTDSQPIRGLDKLTYAEMGDHLVWRLKRRISRIRTLFKLRWMIHDQGKERDPNTGKYDKDREGDKRTAQQLAAIMMLAQFYTRPKREVDEKEDTVYKEVREALAESCQWELFFDELKAELEGTEEKARSKSGQKRDKLRDAARAMLEAKVCDFEKLGKTLDDELSNHLEGGTATSLLVERVANWCLPLRHRKWHWHPDKAKPELKQGKEGDCADHVPKIQGMRGLGLKRLEQVLSLRQLCQSYAKIEKRWLQDDEGNKTGINDLVIPRNAVLHDPCVELLDKSNELREQRVYQTAHLILTEALGVKLKNPMDVKRDDKTKKQLKSEVDLHGEYEPKTFVDHHGKEVNLPKCSVIVLEDLSRYRTSQERTKSENSRLMQWSHRAIIDKLVDMAKPFGITIMLVDPAWSSRFDNRTGAAGIRVNEVEKGFETTMPYAAWLKRKGRGRKPNELAERIKALAEQFNDEKHAPLFASEKERKKRTLLIGVDGGERFLPVTDAHRNDAAWDRLKITLNADKNAAVNIGLRALAHPDRLDIFSRIKTEKKGEGRVRVRNRRGFFASLDDSDPKRELRTDWNAALEEAPINGGNEATNEDEDGTESSECPDYFAVTGTTSFAKVNELPESKRSRCHPETAKELPGFAAYERPLFLTKVQEACYDRIKAINDARIRAWEEKAAKPDPNDVIPMT